MSNKIFVQNFLGPEKTCAKKGVPKFLRIKHEIQKFFGFKRNVCPKFFLVRIVQNKVASKKFWFKTFCGQIFWVQKECGLRIGMQK